MWKWIKENILANPEEVIRRKINEAMENIKAKPIFDGQNGNGYQPTSYSTPMPKVNPPKPEPNPKERLISKLIPVLYEFEKETGLEIIDIMIIKYSGGRDWNIITK